MLWLSRICVWIFFFTWEACERVLNFEIQIYWKLIRWRTKKSENKVRNSVISFRLKSATYFGFFDTFFLSFLPSFLLFASWKSRKHTKWLHLLFLFSALLVVPPPLLLRWLLLLFIKLYYIFFFFDSVVGVCESGECARKRINYIFHFLFGIW